MISTPWEYKFPEITKPEQMAKQLQHVKAEVDEAIEAYVNEESYWMVAMELMDVIHAAETALRLLNLNQYRMSGVKHSVIEKNDTRGYYGGGE